MNDALGNAINLCVKLTNERLELEIPMNIILPSQFDGFFFILIIRM
jgi:hypothetical protein